MPAERTVGRPHAAVRRPGLVVVGLTARKAARSASVWGAVFGLYVASSAFAYTSTYKTPQARARLVTTLGGNLGFNALIGPAHQIGTVAGFTAWRSLGVLSVVGGVWGLLAGSRLIRGEEEAGRWELLLAGQTTRRRAVGQAIVGLAGGLVVLWAVAALVTVAVGRRQDVGFGVGASLFLAVALVASPAVFLALAALTSQLAATRRQAAGYAAAILGASYALRMIADSGTGLGWLRWLSPLGWVQELRPLTAPRPAYLLPIVGFAALCTALAVRLAGVRDLGASVIPDRTSGTAHTRLLAGPARLAVRLTRGVATSWGVSIALTALLMGLIAKSVGNALSADAGDRETFARLGYHGTGSEQYLAISFLLIAVLIALVAAGEIGHTRGEEADGRLDVLLVRPVSRIRWLTGRLAVAIGYLLAAGLLAGLTSWLGAASQHSGVGLPTLLAAGVNVVPPALVVLGSGVLTFGLWPRAVAPVSYGVLAWSFLVQLIGSVANTSHWLLDTSLFHHMAAAPAGPPNWASNAVLAALAVVAGVLGVLAFNRRDLAGE